MIDENLRQHYRSVKLQPAKLRARYSLLCFIDLAETKLILQLYICLMTITGSYCWLSRSSTVCRLSLCGDFCQSVSLSVWQSVSSSHIQNEIEPQCCPAPSITDCGVTQAAVHHQAHHRHEEAGTLHPPPPEVTQTCQRRPHCEQEVTQQEQELLLWGPAGSQQGLCPCPAQG